MSNRFVPQVNWAGNVPFTVRQLVQPDASASHAARLAALSSAVAEAASNGRHVRGMGSLYSFTDVVAGTDWAVDPTGLVQVLSLTSASGSWAGPLGGALSGFAKANAKAYVHVESGISVHDVLGALDTQGFGIMTMGSTSGQRVAGVLSTGTHGGDFNLPPGSDFIRAIHLVDATGQLHWLERAAEPLTAGAAQAQVLAGASSVVHYDDELFEAALVAVGTFGFITDVVTQVREPYLLSEKVDQKKWSEIRPLLASGEAFNSPPNGPHPNTPAGASYRTLEVHLNPFMNGADRDVWVVTRMEAPMSGAPGKWVRPSSSVDQIGLWLNVEFGDADAYRKQIDTLISSNRDNTNGFFPSLRVADTGIGQPPLPVLSIELAIPTAGNAHLAFIDAMLNVFNQRVAAGDKFSGFPSLRFTRPSRAMLAMQADGAPTDRVCHCEIAGLQKIDHLVPDPNQMEGTNREILDEIARIAVSLGARMHWGQDTFPDVGHPTTTYKRLGTFLTNRAKLPGAASLRYDNNRTVCAGLALLPAGFSPVAGVPVTARSQAPDNVAPLFAGPATPLVTNDGRSFVYFVNGDGRVATSAFLQGDGAWTDWTALPMSDWTRYVTQPVAAASNKDGHPEVVARFDNGVVRHAWRDDTGWSEFQDLDAPASFADSPPACLPDAEGFIHAFAMTRGQQLQSCRQQSQFGVVGWTGFSDLPKSPQRLQGAVSVVQRADGKLEVYAVDETGAVALLAQSFPTSDSAWLPWAALGVSSSAAPAAEVGGDGGTAVATVDPASRCLAVSFRAPGATAFTAATLLGGQPVDPTLQPALVSFGSTYWVAARSGANLVVAPFAPATGFGAAQLLPVGNVSAPCLTRLSDGSAAVLVKLAHDVVVYRRM